MTVRVGDPHLGLIVEGRGDRSSVPVLLRKYMYEDGDYRDVLGPPVDIKGIGNATKQNGIEGYASAAGNRPGCLGLLVVLDGEGEDVSVLGPSLQARAQPVSRAPVKVCLADRDFEDWLFASAETLDLGLTFRGGVRGGSLIKQSFRPSVYTKPVDQPRLAARMDISTARARSASLERMLSRFDIMRGGM